MFSVKSLIWKSTLGVFLLVAITRCGGGDDSSQPPNPTPAPAPNTPYPPQGPIAPPMGGIIPGTNCPTIAGDRNLRQDGSPFLGQLQGNNSLVMSVMFSQYQNFDTGIQNVVAAGQFTFPDISYMLGSQVSNYNYNICVSSLGFNGSPATQGTFNLQDLSVAMLVRGYVDVPLYSPYGGYPGGYPGGYYPPGSTTPTMGKETIELAIGNGYNCPAYLYQGRIYGCVEVRLGRTAPFYLQSR